MKKIHLSLISGFFLVVLFFISCGKDNPDAPAVPLTTSTLTPAITAPPQNTYTSTPAQSPTFTATRTVTGTMTFTATPSSTSTPDYILVDDFSDGNLINLISTNYSNLWTADDDSDIGGFSYVSTEVLSTHSGTGYCVSMTGTAVALQGAAPYFGEVFLHTTLKPWSTTSYDLTAKEKISCKIRSAVISTTGGVLSYTIRITNSTGQFMYYIYASTGDWQDLNIPFSSFSLVGGTLNQILSTAEKLSFTIKINSGTANLVAEVAMQVDDVRFGMLP